MWQKKLEEQTKYISHNKCFWRRQSDKGEGVGGKQRRIPIGHVGVCLSIDSNTPSTYRNVH